MFCDYFMEVFFFLLVVGTHLIAIIQFDILQFFSCVVGRTYGLVKKIFDFSFYSIYWEVVVSE